MKMKDEHRSILAAGLSFAVLIGWYFLFGQHQMQPMPPAATVANQPTSETSATAPVFDPAKKDQNQTYAPKPETTKVTETLVKTLEWTSHGGRLSRVQLKGFHQDVKKDSPLINLISSENEKALDVVCRSCNTELPRDDLYQQTSADQDSIVFEGENEGLKVTKQYQWDDTGYLFQLKVIVENKKKEDFQGQLGLGWIAQQLPPPPPSTFSFLKGPGNHRGFLYKSVKKVVHKEKAGETIELGGEVPWVGIADRYFLISLIANRVSADEFISLKPDGNFLHMSLYPAAVKIPAGGRHEESYSFYLGPKDRNSLAAAHVGLEDAIDYGWFAILALPILKLLQYFYAAVKNWGVTIILLTLFIKILTNPLTVKSMKQMREMQKLQPKINALKEKYKNDRQALNAETMALFRQHKINPAGGCVPMLLQMPIYVVLYKVLYNAIELYHAPFFGIYRDLSAPDPYLILPILLGILMVMQQKLTPSPSADPAQKQMMMIMPIMFTGFMLFLPVGLVIYIFVNTFFSVFQQGMYQKGLRWRDLLRGNFKPTQA
jgi:YidC/Oxa1 family membrane protein insertase